MKHWFFGEIDFGDFILWYDTIWIDNQKVTLDLLGIEECVNQEILDIMANYCQNLTELIKKSQPILRDYLQKEDRFIYFHREYDEYQNLDIEQCLAMLRLTRFSMHIEDDNFIKLDFVITNNEQALCVIFDVCDNGEAIFDEVYWGEL